MHSKQTLLQSCNTIALRVWGSGRRFHPGFLRRRGYHLGFLSRSVFLQRRSTFRKLYSLRIFDIRSPLLRCAVVGRFQVLGHVTTNALRGIFGHSSVSDAHMWIGFLRAKNISQLFSTSIAQFSASLYVRLSFFARL